jgi:carboxypeptidase C (cathepsin A)
MFKPQILSAILLAFAFTVVLSAPDADLVNLASVPGLDQFTNYTAKIYSGYLYINENKSHHYIFVESQSNPSSDPLVLWLNGGPGCSSILGFLYEHGPFVYPDGSTELMFNEYAWNQNANMLYMESPACVGLSYCSDAAMVFDDDGTASDNLIALVDWFTKFPEYQGREFFVSGESYAGVYVPYLSYYIDQYNSKSTSTIKINLVGYAVGNPVTNTNFDSFSDLQFWKTHAAVSPSTIQEINTHCSPNSFDNNFCSQLMNDLNTDLEDINIYDFYRYCYPNATSTGSQYFNRFKSLYQEHYGLYGGYEPDVNRPPCIDDVGAFLFLNNQSVRL